MPAPRPRENLPSQTVRHPPQGPHKTSPQSVISPREHPQTPLVHFPPIQPEPRRQKIRWRTTHHRTPPLPHGLPSLPEPPLPPCPAPTPRGSTPSPARMAFSALSGIRRARTRTPPVHVSP